MSELVDRPGDGRRPPTATTGMLADDVLSTAHAQLAEPRESVLNEKPLVQRAGLGQVQALLARPGTGATELAATVAAVAEALGVEPLSAR